jgi:hypothetical protein
LAFYDAEDQWKTKKYLSKILIYRNFRDHAKREGALKSSKEQIIPKTIKGPPPHIYEPENFFAYEHAGFIAEA